ncbi:MAG TPA: HEAT repeat domain-containing protein [Pirellulales bacterium]|nr:HEAT repeat domain-containing protein [Pirellulales bacterium]
MFVRLSCLSVYVALLAAVGLSVDPRPTAGIADAPTAESAPSLAAHAAELRKYHAALLKDLETPGLREHALRVLIDAGLEDQIPIATLDEISRGGSPAARRRAWGVLSRKDIYWPPVRAALARLATGRSTDPLRALVASLVDASPDDLALSPAIQPPSATRPEEKQPLASGNADIFAGLLAALDQRPKTIFDIPMPGYRPGAHVTDPFERPYNSLPIDRLASSTLAELLNSLKDRHPQVRRLACTELGKRATTLPKGAMRTRLIIRALTEAARDDDAMVRYDAVGSLVRVGHALRAGGPGTIDPQILAVLIVALADESLMVRQTALWELEDFKGPSARLDAALLKLLDDRQTRDDALLLLVQRGLQSRIPFEVLTQAAAEGGTAARRCALRMLGDRNLNDEQTKSLLGRLASDPDPNIRALAAARLWALTPTLDRFAALQAAVLNDSSPQAIEVLANSGPAAIGALAELAANGGRYIRQPAASVLERVMTQENAMPAIVQLFDSGSPRVREWCAHALGDFGPKAASAVPALARHLADESELVRLYSAYALASIGPAAREAVPALQQAAKSDDPALRSAATHALAKIEPAAEQR